MQQTGYLWLFFAVAAFASWGLYGVLLHTGQMSMGDPANGRYKAFLMVGIAYVIIAVVGPAIILAVNGASWSMPAKGITWSLFAGVSGAIGALCVLLAFGARGQPAVVMSIVFAGAPVVNAAVALMVHPPHGGWGSIRWQFFLGIGLAALGGTLVTMYKPGPPPPAKAPPVEADTGEGG